jgi:hypothetical protein
MFGRKSGPQEQSTTTTPTAEEVAAAAAPKGRPTPSRKEAEAARKERLKPTLDKKEAARRDRENRTRQRESMMAGDERALMPRDQGPVRKSIRNYVDGRWSAGELFLPGAVIILMLGFVSSSLVKSLSLWIWLALVIAIAIDSVFLVRGMRRRLLAECPDDDLKGSNFYAIMRSLQIRRLRVPKCQVKPGGRPVTKR